MDGKPVRIGDKDYLVPDATLETAELIAGRLEELAKGGMSSSGALADVVALALRENYPDISAAELKRVIKVKDAGRIMREVLVAIGLEAGQGEAVAP